MMSAAVAHSNIALAKYWGKLPREGNFPAVPSLSVTLGALKTITRVGFDARLTEDRVSIDGKVASGRSRDRVVRVLDELRAIAGRSCRAEVDSHNEFPTGAGLASSASGFAALALAGQAALGLDLTREEVSRIARRASASAARSLFGGYVELLPGAEAARALAPPNWLDLVVLIVITSSAPKATSSTQGMLLTQATSPYYRAWLDAASEVFAEARRALMARDFAALGAATEHSMLLMHASALAARPAVCYLTDASWRVVACVDRLRAAGVLAFSTLDAGPNVKVLVRSEDAPRTAEVIERIGGVERVIVSQAGPEACLVD